jgi:hypothetical protein
MGKYCDNKELEKIWSRWEFAKDTPELEILRDSGMLFTRVMDGSSKHFINSIQPFHFCTEVGIKTCQSDIASAFRASLLPGSFVPFRSPSKEYVLCPTDEEEYYQDNPIIKYWDILVDMIYKICNGISLKFHPGNADERSELVHEALSHVLSKLKRNKLSFTPGRAPAFNLLTTAIYRIMCSIKNKSKRYRDNRSGLAEDIYNGKTLPGFRSLTVAESAAFTTYADK